MSGNNLDTPPQHDEAEISVFGPGYGESILVHLGFNEWIVIDSCFDPKFDLPPPINYLKTIGINPAEAVKLVIATHWHDDHVRGISSVFQECQSARFVCSAALRSDEFLELISALGTRPMMTSSGVNEFQKTITILQERLNFGRPESRGPQWAFENCVLLRRDGSEIPYEIHSLSPSSAAVTLANVEIGSLLPTFKKRKKRVVAQRPNRVAVVLWISIGEVKLLLGSDLEETSDHGTGWSVIVDSTARPPGKASVFKVPHHGSETAHQPGVWSEMVEDAPFAVLTPFNQGNIHLPTKSDAERICNLTSNAYSTARLRQRSKRRAGIVEKMIKETVRRIQVVSGPTGHVRLRRKALGLDNEWGVELFGEALDLSQTLKAM